MYDWQKAQMKESKDFDAMENEIMWSVEIKKGRGLEGCVSDTRLWEAYAKLKCIAYFDEGLQWSNKALGRDWKNNPWEKSIQYEWCKRADDILIPLLKSDRLYPVIADGQTIVRTLVTFTRNRNVPDHWGCREWTMFSELSRVISVDEMSKIRKFLENAVSEPKATSADAFYACITEDEDTEE